ncbi:hypothetical protein [Streptoalloteichus hindustanus]|uniref:DoxX-like family protein n=1 Tax=Streptoalloteichus hindustanus TaxID=2017 RepID=A0A1M5MJE1_STRHI|nr:hypothetical protein [Streptoalloteichus hindustanus]SHG76873.1 hypothetical protein SAMN05444320_113125 [Streptoalloteichus hindustanus]
MTFLRIGLWFLAATQAGVGGWALLAPQGFYDGFPAPGHHWVAMFPPFNEHLVRDFGALNLGFAVALAFAAVTADRLLVQAVLAAYLTFSVPHMVFHLGHLDHMPVVDQVGNVVTLALAVVLPVALIVVVRRRATT